MQLYIFNSKIELLGIVDEIKELEWVREYYRGGECTVEAMVTPTNIALLKKGNIIVKSDDTTEAMVIEYRELEEDINGVEVLLVKGNSLTTRILSSRITAHRQIEKATADKIMERLLHKQTNGSTNKRRHIKALEIDTSVKKEFTKTYEHNSLYKNLDEEFEAISMMDQCGHRIELDIERKKFIFKAYKGKDVSEDTVFTQEFDNIASAVLKESDDGFKNVNLVCGQGLTDSEDGRDNVFVNDELYSDFERQEMFTDARDIDMDKKTVGDEEVQIPMGPQALALLKQRGLEKLNEVQKTTNYNADIIEANYIYREDFDLGDIVTVRHDSWNVYRQERITQIVELYTVYGREIKVHFGLEMPTLQDKIKQKIGRI